MTVVELSHEREQDETTLQSLLGTCVLGQLAGEDRATLERHLGVCADCAAELEAMMTFAAVLGPMEGDAALDRAAIVGAMARLEAQPDGPPLLAVSRAIQPGDEALDRAAVESALSRLGAGESFTTRLRRWWRPAAGYAALGAVATAAILLALGRAPTSSRSLSQSMSTAAPPPLAGTHGLVLRDGSEIAPDDAKAEFQVAEETPTRTIVRVAAGTTSFRVRHDPRRLFRVDAGPIRIEDLGTVFRVAYEPGERVRVTVSEGRVVVLGPEEGARLELGAGEDQVLPVAPPARRPANEPAVEAPAARLSRTVPIPPRAQARGRGTNDPGELLAASDDARRAGQPRAAVTSLRRLIERYPGDPRAPSAAFTLGWVLLTDLDRPREAAQAFAEAERIAPRGALAEDAAARVVESWQKANEPRRAAEAARRYLRVYGAGRYTGLMRGLVGER